MENRKEIDLFKVGSVFSMAPVARIFYIFSHCTYCIKSWLLKPVVDLMDLEKKSVSIHRVHIER